MEINTQVADGIFCLRGIYTKDTKIRKAIIASVFSLFAVFLFIVRDRSTPLGTLILFLIFVIPVIYIISLLKKRPGIHLQGIQIRDHQAEGVEWIINTHDLSRVIRERKSIKRKKFLGSQGNPYQVVTSEIASAEAKKKSAQSAVESDAKLVFSIAQQDPGQQMISTGVTTPWHLSKIELTKENKVGFLLTAGPSDLCMIKDNKLFFHFQDDEKEAGEKILCQIRMLGEIFHAFVSPNKRSITIRIIPAKSNKAAAGVFGVVGLAGAALMDQYKKTRLLDQIKSGNIILINRQTDLQLLRLLDQMNWDITV